MSRSDCKPFADSYDYANLRRSLLVPSGVEDSSLRTDGIFAYRDLDECLALIEDYVEVEERFGVVGYMGSSWLNGKTTYASWPSHFPQMYGPPSLRAKVFRKPAVTRFCIQEPGMLPRSSERGQPQWGSAVTRS